MIKKEIAFFDFDGTISNKNSFKGFLLFVYGKPKFYLKITKLLYTFLKFKLKIEDPVVVKEKLITEYLKDMDYLEYNKYCKDYADSPIFRSILREKALKEIENHKKNNVEVVIVSASIEGWLKYYCKDNNINLISTIREVKEKKLTGKLFSLNCFGINKVKMIKEQYNLDYYSKIYVYGDSFGDTEMLKLSTKDNSYYKPFRK